MTLPLYVLAARITLVEGPAPLRTMLFAEPIHEVDTGDYLIGKLEVTFAQYIEFLGAQPESRRPKRLNAESELHQCVRVLFQCEGLRTGER